MLTWVRADLHVHTCLSPCGDLTMSPRRIVAEARKQGVTLVAVTDHNSAANAGAVSQAAAGSGVTVLPGLEICTREEVHVLGLFAALPAALVMQELVYGCISMMNEPELFGEQVIVNAAHEVEGFEPRLLIGATTMSVDETVRQIHALGGLAVAAHADRESFGIIGQLGFVPPGLMLDAFEVSGTASSASLDLLRKEHREAPWIRNSDAHTPDQIGKGTTLFLMEERTCAELARALRGEEGRMVKLPTAES